MEEYLAMIKLFAGTFKPRGFVMCNGQLMSIAQNNALFALIGTTYGGDGMTTFAAPDLRGRAPIGTGQSSQSGTNYVLGQWGGVENMTLTSNNMPMHTHAATSTGTISSITVMASSAQATAHQPSSANNVLAASFDPVNGDSIDTYGATAPDIVLNTGASGGSVAISTIVQPAGGSMPFSIMSPYLAMNYVMVSEGIFPSRD